MLSDRLRPVLEPLTSGVGRALARARLTPNVLTTVGLLGVLACSWIIANGELVLGGILLIPAVLLDMLDGAVARASGRVTAWGGYYDSLCDRIADGALMSAIAWQAHRAGNDDILLAALAALVLSFVVPYARAKAEAMGVRPASGPGERPERYVLVLFGLIFGPILLMLWIIVALTAYTSVMRSLAVRRAVS